MSHRLEGSSESSLIGLVVCFVGITVALMMLFITLYDGNKKEEIPFPPGSRTGHTIELPCGGGSCSAAAALGS